jgi:formate hydrogenlyase subunit 3/multisubunit Na+/H+ antiporter MnhD subunit
VPVFVLGSVCAVYGAVYMRVHAGRALGPQAFFFNVTMAAMILVLLARNAIVLLIAWEVMTLASYLLVSFEDERAEARRAGWVYLIAGHVGVACLIALFLTLGRLGGDFAFSAFAHHAPEGGVALLVLVLAAFGFGIKAGVVPLHVWLPEAHAAAPSHVSALMSGVLIKLGLYGLLRVSTFVLLPRWWGPALIAFGAAGGLLGISLAAYQRDLKRALAYSSVENVGIILLGIGVGFWGLANGHQRAGTLAMYGALLHVWNHAAIKGLLFLSAGSVLHGAGSKDLERLGGLLRRMPWTGTLTILGAVAITGLPPLSAFFSEWLIYMGLLRGGMAATSGWGLVLFFVSAALATMGAVAALCFGRLVGVGLLGQPRSKPAEHAHESSAWMLGPMAVLAVATIGMSLAAPRLLVVFARPVAQLAAAPLAAQVAAIELRPIAMVTAGLWAGLLLVGTAFWLRVRKRPAADETWGCGYLAPTPRMQYTARAFAELLAEKILPRSIRARVTLRPPTGLFAEAAGLSADPTDPVTRSAYEPFFDRWARRFSRLRWLQQGVLHVYLFYILIVVVAALGWASARRWWWGSA